MAQVDMSAAAVEDLDALILTHSRPRSGERAGRRYPRDMNPEGASKVDEPGRAPDSGVVRRLDDEHLLASLRAMSMGERLESGFELCEFASELAGSARR